MTTLHPANPRIYMAIAVSTILFAAAALAIPAVWALRINPIIALGIE